ncbi:MAG: HAMP domain-containing histidine kinase [Leptospiraceae bacterium]|nr:HAMP domain-containing histidine kinase [Leptospiraceae bacterium]
MDRIDEIFLELQFSSIRFAEEEHLVLSLRDITERKQNEQEIHNQNDLLRLSVAQAEAASRAKSLFLANMTHELKTPLNSMLGYAQYLQMPQLGSLSDRQAEAVSSIESSGRHLLKLVEQILDYSRMEAGRMPLDRSDCDLAGLIHECIQGFRHVTRNKEIELEENLPAGPVHVNCDQTRIRQVLDNLLTNAARHTDAGGRIEVSLLEGADNVLIRVADTGHGMPAEDQERIFEPFEQSVSDRSRKREGTGLGLAIVKRIVDMHQGFITLQTAPGEGATFTIGLPH